MDQGLGRPAQAKWPACEPQGPPYNSITEFIPMPHGRTGLAEGTAPTRDKELMTLVYPLAGFGNSQAKRGLEQGLNFTIHR